MAENRLFGLFVGSFVVPDVRIVNKFKSSEEILLWDSVRDFVFGDFEALDSFNSPAFPVYVRLS